MGPKRAEALRKLEILTVKDLLTHYPREHDDRTERIPIGRASPSPSKTLRGMVQAFDVIPAGRNLAVGKAIIGDGTGYILAVWFRRASFRYDVFASLRRQLVKGASVLVHGPIERNHNGLQIRVDEFEILGAPETKPVHADRIVPLYGSTEGIDPRWLRELIWDALQVHLPEVREHLPDPFLKTHNLVPLSWAVQNIHFPSTWADLEKAHRRLAFEEFFFLELAIARAREKRMEGPRANSFVPTKAYLTPFRQTLGFDFTAAQKRVINEIFADMASDKPMNRLLQGDVGSGKTIVALAAMLLAVENGRQAALMAPTEILAEQHSLTLGKFLKGLPLRWALLTGHVPKKQRQEQLKQLKSGEVHLAVGTHALIQE
ncbi:MAG: DEAD/DEAH box helicase, partial [Elusimicrobia bacterium]|nr:DEAD/DEAH box helicase [Elusimicrobiota bacterium]